MNTNFAEVVEQVKKLSIEDKEELRALLEKYLVDERREEVLKNYDQSLNELKEGKLEFSTDINRLKELINEY